MTQTKTDEELSNDVMDLVDFQGGADEGDKKAEDEPQQPLEDTDKSQEVETNEEESDKKDQDQANGASENNENKEGEGMGENEEDEYEVEAIVDHKKTKVKTLSTMLLTYCRI